MTTNLIEKLQQLSQESVGEQYKIIQRCYCWSTVFISKLPENNKQEGKLELQRILDLTKLTGSSLGEQLVLELAHPNEFLTEFYFEFVSSLFFLAGIEEEKLDEGIKERASNVALNECTDLVYRQLTDV